MTEDTEEIEMMQEKKEIYLDNSATTRCLDSVVEEMARVCREDYGNPSSAHHQGVVAEQRVREARAQIARTLRCKPEEIVFTSGGTESDNLALLGALHTMRGRQRLITTQIEHPAVLRTAEHIGTVTYLPVDACGVVSVSDVEAAVTEETYMVSVMHTNNEIGSVQPLAEIGQMLKRKHPEVLFHVDAVQGYGKARIYPQQMGIDLMSVSAHKIHGPKGVGFLYVRSGVRLTPLLHGGGQQGGLRSGTENVPGIVGMALAAQELYARLDADVERMYALKQYFIDGLLGIEGVRVNGVLSDHAPEGPRDQDPDSEALPPSTRSGAPHIVSASFAGVRAEVLLHALEAEGIYVSAGSACATHKATVSETLQAIGLPRELLDATLRFSFSIETTQDDLERTLDALRRLVPELRRFTRR